MPFPYGFPFDFDAQVTSSAIATGVGTMTCIAHRGFTTSATAIGVGTMTCDAREAITRAFAIATGVGTATCIGHALLWEAQQSSSPKVLCKVVLTKATKDTLTYTNEDRLVIDSHIESNDSYIAQLTLRNNDNFFTELNLTGYAVAMYWGMRTDGGDLYAPKASLIVISQQLTSAGGVLLCSIYCISKLDQLSEQTASENYLPPSTNTDTLKTIANNILGTGAYGYAGYGLAVTTSWDSEDSLIDYLVLKNYFKVYENEARLTALNEALGYSKEVKRLDSDNKIHFINPTISGTTYDYEYELGGDHEFYAKTYSNNLIMPNLFVVSDGAGNLGSATDATSWGIRPRYRFYEVPVISDADGNLVAAAMLQRATLSSQGLDIRVPMNVFQRVWDYIKITDSREGGVSRTGNPQYIKRYSNFYTSENSMVVRFGGSGTLPSGNLGISVKDNILKEPGPELPIIPGFLPTPPYDPSFPIGSETIRPPQMVTDTEFREKIWEIGLGMLMMADAINKNTDRLKEIPQAHITDAPAGGTGAAAGAWDTAAHRDAAIATINDIVTKLETLGFVSSS